jgi:hypothetical protein
MQRHCYRTSTDTATGLLQTLLQAMLQSYRATRTVTGNASDTAGVDTRVKA